MKHEIRLAGFGGQGIILAGHILGKSAAIYEKKNAVLTQSYGPEARGGACSADLVVSDTNIEYPKLTIPGYLVVMSQEAYTTYGKKLRKDGMLIIDEDLVKVEKERDVHAAPFTRMAESLGKKIIANIVMLGFFTAMTGIVSYEAMKQAILTSVPKGTEELNLTAFDKGYEYGKKKANPPNY